MAVSLEAIQAAGKHEKSIEHADIWAAIDAIISALGEAVPAEHAQKAQSYLLRSGRVTPGDFTDAELFNLASAGGTREWRPDMGEVREGEIITHEGVTYVVMDGKGHVAQADWEPGTIGGTTLFRPVREEPGPDSEKILVFMPGELVPFGAKRRDPSDGKVYTPIKETGVVLYEPHLPHLVPSEYKLVVEDVPPDPGPDDGGETLYPTWDSLEDNHAFAVGDRFQEDGGKTWEVKRAFGKQQNWRPPALAGDYYVEI